MNYEQDYILRLIQKVGVLLRAMLKALSERRPEHALEVSTEALHSLTGLTAVAAETLSAHSLVSLLSVGDRLDLRRTLTLSEVFLRRADALEMMGDADKSAAERAKAFELALAVSAEADGDYLALARELLADASRSNADLSDR